MATQICPSCKKDSFTWSIDEVETRLTLWGCYQCGYEAFENESDERTCTKCGKGSQLKLKDTEKDYWWCPLCDTTELIKKYF